ncbi:MAG: hypothetical protein WCD89_08715 [Anaerocolumna sp.]
MDNELKGILENILEKMDKIDKRLEIVEYKVDRNSEKIDNLDIKVRVAESNIRKDIKKLSDENDTVIEVLKQNQLLPR